MFAGRVFEQSRFDHLSPPELTAIVSYVFARELDGVDAALARITEGKYGTCVDCGKEIDPARMEARPESIYCVDCKAKLS